MNLLDQIVSTVIRPTRDIYTLSDLGSKKFLVQGSNGSLLQVDRYDQIILNSHGQRIHLSYYKTSPKGYDNQKRSDNQKPTLIYVHANNGSRMEGHYYLKTLLQNSINVILFDCSGSGISDGDFITLGMRQSEDLNSVIQHMISKKRISNICLWGRSMGAVTVLLYASKSIRPIKCCIFDSPFANLRRLVKQIGINKTSLPQFFLNPLLSLIQNSVQQKAGCKLFSLDLIQKVKRIICPALFITSKSDKLVDCSHVQELYSNFRSKKQLIYINQQHHESRDKNTMQACVKFILSNNKPQNFNLYQSQTFNRQSYQKNQKIYTESDDQIKMKQSLMVHSPSEQYLSNNTMNDNSNKFKKKFQRKSLSQKISITAFRKDSLKFKQKGKLQINKLTESKVVGYEQNKDSLGIDARISQYFDQTKKGVRRIHLYK